ncbi:membrane protein [gut metagenome]|uniref:Membrane protein n=1 Tax=gut metagenome TaxID=749906 RepID=J9FXJ0_9ZZZZ
MGLRAALIASFFLIGMCLLIVGWKMTGQLKGLGIMIVGLILLLTALMLYNKPFEDPKE